MKKTITDISSPPMEITRKNGEMVVLVHEAGKDRKMRRKAHIGYRDMATGLKVYMEDQEQIVEVPVTRSGVGAMNLVPASLTHGLVSKIVMKKVMMIEDQMSRDPDYMPDNKDLKDMVQLQKETQGLLNNAWEMATSGPSEGEGGPGKSKVVNHTLNQIITDTVHIGSSVAGGRAKEMNMEELGNSLLKLRVTGAKAIDEMDKAEKQRLREEKKRKSYVQRAEIPEMKVSVSKDEELDEDDDNTDEDAEEEDSEENRLGDM